MSSQQGKSKIQQVLDLVTDLSTQMQLMMQKIAGIEQDAVEQNSEIKLIKERVEKVEKDFIRHETEHETKDKEKTGNLKWLQIITAAGVLLLSILQFVK